MFQSQSFDDLPFKVGIRPPEAGRDSWQWLVSSPGKFLLSGDAGTRDGAVEAARAVGHELARLAALA